MSQVPLDQQEPSAPTPPPAAEPTGPQAAHTHPVSPGGSGLQSEQAAGEPVETPNNPTAAEAEPATTSAPEAEPASDTDNAEPTVEAEPEIKEGGIQRAKVLQVTADEVLLDLGGQAQGAVPFIEFAGHPTPKPDDEVSVIVEKFDPVAGVLVLSRRHADEVLFWQSVQRGDLLEGVVTGMNKGGLDIDIGGAKAFLPASQVDVHRMKDISILIGEHVQCMVTQVDRTTQDLVVSRRKVIEKQRRDKRQEALSSLVEGEIRKGKVSNLTDYGAFVDLGGVDGLIHITDMSWSRIKHPSDVVKMGQEIDVRVLNIDRKKGKVSLGLKQTKPNPWDTAETRYPVGSKVRGRVVRVVDFGAFLELEEDIDALLPISEMSWSHHIGRPSELVKVGDEPEVVVLKVEPDRQRISVGLKQTQENPWSTVQSRFPVNESVKGKVSKVADFGAFVELAPGVEGLMHISELSDHRVEAVSDVVQEGQEVQVRVLKVDPVAQRISLSMRPPPPAGSAAHAQAEEAKARAKRKRKKPLRGGLSSHFDW